MRIGFIGGYGHHYLRGVLGEPGDEPTHVAVAGDDVHPQSAADMCAALRQRYPAIHIDYFDRGTDLLDTFRPDLLSVGAVFGVNGEWNARALARGIPTVTDKPCATTRPQLARLQELIDADPTRVLLTEFPFRCTPAFRAARTAVRDGAIGSVVLVSAQKSYRFGTRPAWYGRRDDFGGLLLWVASHAVDALAFVTGVGIARATGRAGNLSQPAFAEMEDHLALVAELTGGATAVIHADYARPQAAATHADDRMRVVGSAGVIEIRSGRCVLTTNDEGERDITDSADVRPVHVELLAAARGTPSELYSSQDTLRTAATLLVLRAAVDTRQWLDIA